MNTGPTNENTASSHDVRFIIQLTTMFVILTLLSLSTTLNAIWIYSLVLAASMLTLVSLLSDRKYWLAIVAGATFLITVLMTAKSLQ